MSTADEMRRIIDLLLKDQTTTLMEAQRPSRASILARAVQQDVRLGRSVVPLFTKLGYPMESAQEFSLMSYRNAGEDDALLSLLETLKQVGLLAAKHGMNSITQQTYMHHEFWYDCLTKEDWAAAGSRMRSQGADESIEDYLMDHDIDDLDAFDRWLGHPSVASTIRKVTDNLPEEEEAMYLFSQLAGVEMDDEGVYGINQDDVGKLAEAYRGLWIKLYDTRPDVHGRDW